jgi:FlaA1/EpsC-like NDP-sugar epimerase
MPGGTTVPEGTSLLARRAARVAIDIAALAGAYVLAHLVRFDGAVPGDQLGRLVVSLPYVVLLQWAALSAIQTHRVSWRYTSVTELLDLVRALLAAAMVLGAARIIAEPLAGTWGAARYAITPFGIIVSDLVLGVAALAGVRVARRLQAEAAEQRGRTGAAAAGPVRRVLLIGAGRAGVMVARELEQRPDLGMRAVGFVDDDPHKARQVISGVPVVGTTADLPKLAERLRPDQTIISIASADGATIRRITAACEDAGLEPDIIPGVYEIVGGQVNLSRIRPVAIEDLLGREPVELDVSAIRQYVTHDVVLVTGAGGSIGSELCRQLAAFDPKRIVLVEQAENALWAIHRELEASLDGSIDLVPAVADVTDADRIRRLFLLHRPSVVFHAAAHKHVPMMEWNPGEAIKNNVLGTKVVADAAAQHGTRRFVMISTDKAVNPTSIMGATKRIAERYVQHLAHETGRPFVSVRFGNVLGSSGSVIPVFEEQIARGGPVTVTHPDMVRFFMTIPEASQLVLQAGALGEAGEVFVLDMGEPVKIVDLARDLIRLSGFEPDADIAIEYTGVRPGEKMYEEIALTGENADPTTHAKIFTCRTPSAAWDSWSVDLDELTAGAERLTRDEARELLPRLVPEFRALDRSPTAEDTATFLALSDDPVEPLA